MSDKLPTPPQPTAPRRLSPAVLLPPLVLLAIAVPAAVALRDDDGDTRAVNPTTTRPAITSTAAQATSTTAAPGATSITPAGGSTTTSVVRSATTAAPPGTEAPASTTTTTGPPARCGPDAFSVSLATDKSTYARGEPVRITSTVTNRSSTPCTLPNYTFTFRVENEASATVGPAGTIRADSQPQFLQPNQRLTVNTVYEPLVCGTSGACTPAPAGSYTVIGTWGVSSPPPPEGSASFRFEG